MLAVRMWALRYKATAPARMGAGCRSCTQPLPSGVLSGECNACHFLHRDDVKPTSNSSERDLRPSVIHRKVIGGFRSAWGAEASAIRTSILATARKQEQHLFNAFRAIAGPSPLQAIPAYL